MTVHDPSPFTMSHEFELKKIFCDTNSARSRIFDTECLISFWRNKFFSSEFRAETVSLWFRIVWIFSDNPISEPFISIFSFLERRVRDILYVEIRPGHPSSLKSVIICYSELIPVLHCCRVKLQRLSEPLDKLSKSVTS